MAKNGWWMNEFFREPQETYNLSFSTSASFYLCSEKMTGPKLCHYPVCNSCPVSRDHSHILLQPLTDLTVEFLSCKNSNNHQMAEKREPFSSQFGSSALLWEKDLPAYPTKPKRNGNVKTCFGGKAAPRDFSEFKFVLENLPVRAGEQT